MEQKQLVINLANMILDYADSMSAYHGAGDKVYTLTEEENAEFSAFLGGIISGVVACDITVPAIIGILRQVNRLQAVLDWAMANSGRTCKIQACK